MCLSPSLMKAHLVLLKSTLLGAQSWESSLEIRELDSFFYEEIELGYYSFLNLARGGRKKQSPIIQTSFCDLSNTGDSDHLYHLPAPSPITRL